MNTSASQSAHIDEHDISLVPLQRADLDNLAKHVALWQRDPNFMMFLKERPMNQKQNLDVFLKDLDTKHCTFRAIQLNTAQELVGFLLFHNFDETQSSLDLCFRVSPEHKGKNICSQAVKQGLPEILQHSGIEHIMGWHSALNTGSFKVFQKSGFQLEQFVPQQTFLPNIDHLTDDFQWRISHALLKKPNLINDVPRAKEMIHHGLSKHNLSLT